MMQFLLFITKHFIKSNQKSGLVSSVSKITIGGISIGITVVILALTILDGFENVVSEKISEFNSQIKITGFGNRNLPAADYVKKKIEEDFKKEIISVEPFLTKLAIIKSKKLTDGINLTGTSASFAADSFEKFLVNGKVFSETENNFEMLIGKNLALRMNVNVGDKITIFSLKGNSPPSQENPPAIEQFVITGIYESGISEYDDGNAFISNKIAKSMFAMFDEVSGYNVSTKKHVDVKGFVGKLQDYLGYPFFVRSIYQVHQNIFTWIELQKKPIPIVLGLIIIVALFNIVGTMLMIVLEKTTSIGILRALGTRRNDILKIFLANSLHIIFWGLLIGISLSVLLSFLQLKFDLISLPSGVYFVTSVPISIRIENYLLVSAITIFTALLSSLIPAFVASKIRPISAIRFE